MSIWSMMGREIAYRKLNFLLGMIGVVVAIAILASILTSLSVHEARSEHIVARKEKETETARAALASDVRKAMHHLGYNAVVLPRDQSLGDYYADDYAAKTMPESWAARLADTRQVVDRYLPRLRRKVDWTERSWTILIVGLGSEHILDTSVSDDTPLVERISPGECVVGHELAAALDLKPNQEIDILGQSYRIAECREELGTKDDITIWMGLSDAQDLLGLTDQINEIAVVEHLSVWGREDEVQQAIAKVLPECQVVELKSHTDTRAHARVKVAEEREASLAQERAKQAALRVERMRMLAKLVPLGSVLCAVWIGLLTYSNVRERRREMGVLLAIGFPLAMMRRLLLAKAVLLGAAGGLMGFVAGAGLALWSDSSGAGLPPFDGPTMIVSLLFSVVLGTLVSLFGSWVPILSAAATDPATVLQDE
ncbi:MAG: ABC transporter permease [Planctomycetota bacterium]